MACRTARPKRDLRRIVRTPDGGVVDDPSGRLAGRGAYVCRDSACLTIAIHKGALKRALETALPEAFLESAAAEAPTIDESTGGGARGQE